MVQLQEVQFDTLKQYVEVANTVEEAIDYVIASYSDETKTEGEVLLADVFNAITRMIDTNGQMIFWFKEEESTVVHLLRLNDLMNELVVLEENFEDEVFRQQFVTDKLAPMYKEWVKNTNILFQGVLTTA